MAVLLLLSVALLTAYFRESDSGVAHSVQSGVLTVVAPLQSGTATATKPFRDAWNWVGDLFTAKSQNGALKKEVQQLRAGLAQELVTQNDNEELRALLRFQRSQVFPKGATMVTGRVIDRTINAWYSTATINVGSSDGVAVDDPVVNGQGLVGRVTTVAANASQVMLVTDQQSHVDAMVEPGGAQGIVGGSVTGDVTLDYVDKSEQVKVGWFVVTSGRNGSIFEKGIPIGQVQTVGSQEVELYQSIAVRPSVDFRKLDIVAVITR
ncbi:MAG TPA: rod shape-determining protein MreC [Thermoleophilia bacterium]|nr:rod shape-determining protein MreC [Thermoleophilia bacterium]